MLAKVTAHGLESIARRHAIELIVQFGSSVSGTVHERSDVDIAVLLGEPDPDWRRQAELQAELQELFPEREVDLVVLDRADPLLLRKIAESGVRIYGDERRFHEWKMYAFKRYQDHRPYLDMERRYVERVLSEQS